MKKMFTAIVCICTAVLSSHAATVVDVDVNNAALGMAGNQWANNFGGGGTLGYAQGRITSSPSFATGTENNGATWNGPDLYVAWSKSGNTGNFGIASNGSAGFRTRLNKGVTGSSKFTVTFSFAVDSTEFSAANDTLTVNGFVGAVDAITSGYIRYVVKSGGSYYISEQGDEIVGSLTGTSNQAFTQTAEALDLTWYEYWPYSNPDGSGASFQEQVDPGARGVIESVISVDSVTPSFTNVTQIGFNLSSVGKAGSVNGANFGIRSFTATAGVDDVDGGGDVLGAVTNSVNWIATDVVAGSTSAYSNFTLDTSAPTVASAEASLDVYGASYAPLRNAPASIDWAVKENNSAGARIRFSNPGGATNGVVSEAYNLFLFPVTNFTDNSAMLAMDLWANQGANGQMITNAGARFVIGTDEGFYISEFFEYEHSASQFNNTGIAATFHNTDWFSYDPVSTLVGVKTVGSSATPVLANGVSFAGFLISAEGLSTSSTTPTAIGGRTFSFTGMAYDEGNNDVLAVDFSSTQITNGIQYEYENFDLRLDLSPQADPTRDDYSGQPIYASLQLDPVDPALVTGSAPGVTNGAAVSFGSNGGAKLQWNGPWPTRNDPGTDDGRYAEGDVATGIFLFKKEDFLNGLDVGNIYMTETNDVLQATVMFDPKVPARLSEGLFRWVIKDNGSYYISSNTVTLTGGAISENLSTGALSVDWLNFDPTTSLTSTSGSASPALDTIEAVGFWTQATVLTNNGIRAYPFIGVSSFKAGIHKDPVTSTSLLNDWLDSHGLSAADLNVDSDGDGMDNLMEYAMGANPGVNDAATHAPAMTASGGVFTHVYQERTDERGLTYTVMLDQASNLVFSDWQTTGLTETRGVDDGSFQSVTNSTDSSAAAKFIRLEVEYSE